MLTRGPSRAGEARWLTRRGPDPPPAARLAGHSQQFDAVRGYFAAVLASVDRSLHSIDCAVNKCKINVVFML